MNMKHAPRIRSRAKCVRVCLCLKQFTDSLCAFPLSLSSSGDTESESATTIRTPPPSPEATTSVKVNSTTRVDPQRPLRCLETLAQKAGISFDEDFAKSPSQSPSSKAARGSVGTPSIRRRHPLLPLSSRSPSAPDSKTTGRKLEKSQSPAQQVAAATNVPLQISPSSCSSYMQTIPTPFR